MSLKTKFLILVITNFILNIHCDETNYQSEDVKTDQLLRGGEDDKAIEDDEALPREIEDETDITTTTEAATTVTEDEDVSRNEEDAQETVDTTPRGDSTDTNDEITLSLIDNHVYNTKDMEGYSNLTSVDNQAKADTIPTQATTRAMDEEPALSREQEQDDEMDISGQRSPKTEDDSKQHPDKRHYEVKPRPLPALSKSSTLKGWLEDSWVRPPAGILVPLRPMALNRALAVWNDLAVGGLNVSDIVIVGYDSNGVNWRSRHNLQPSSVGSGDRAVSEALSKLLLKYQGVHTDATNDGTMRALATAAKLVPYDSALFVVTDKGPGDPQRLPLALRALVEKRLKVYTIWTDPDHPSTESEQALQELRNISQHTEGEVLPYSLQVMDVDSANLAADAELQQWVPIKQGRRGRLNSNAEEDRLDTLLVRRGGGQAISLGLPVENGVTALRVLIEGAVEHAVLYPPNDAAQIDLYNASSVAAFSPASKTEGITPREVYLVFPGSSRHENTFVSGLSVLPANPPRPEAQPELVGMWHLSVRCDTCDYRLCVFATTQIHFDVETGAPDTLKFRVTGPVASVRESQLVDEYGAELAKLPFSYQPMAGDGQDEETDPLVELVADVMIPPVKGSKEYVKIVGRDLKGEPFTRLAGPLNQPEVRFGRSAGLLAPDSLNDLERAEEMNAMFYSSRLRFNDSSPAPYNRAMSQIMNQQGTLLTAVQIGLASRLYGSPGDNLQLHFEVTNYRDQSVAFRFGAVGELRILTGITPSSQTLASGQTVNVIVSATIPSNPTGSRDLVTFTAYGNEEVSISAYVYVVSSGETVSDVWAPEIRHTFQGTCLGRTGSDCAQHSWSTTVIARDALGGLLRLSSSPVGLMYDSSFISGSRDEVIATYRSTCCVPRVIINAVDAFGNTNSYTIDISSYLNGAAIAAIVLGVLLAIALICLFIFLIYWCVKRRQESRELPSYNTRNIS